MFAFTLYEMITRTRVFNGYEDELCKFMLYYGKRPDVNNLDEALTAVLSTCWDKDPENRPDITHLLKTISFIIEQDISQNSIQSNTTYEKLNTNTKNILYSNLDIIAVEGNDPYLGRAQAYMNRGDLEKAIADYKSGLRLDPDNKELAQGLRHARGKVKAKVKNQTIS